MDGIIHVYKLVGERAVPLRSVELKEKSKDILLHLLAAVRASLPSDCVASLTDLAGNNIRPTYEED